MGKPHLLLVGAYGQHNLGDDALLEVFVEQLRREPLMVNSATPGETASRYGVATIPTYGIWPGQAMLRGLLGARAVVFGGGSLLKEIEGSPAARLRYMARVLGLIELSRWAGKPTAMLGVGVGPLRAPLFRRLASLAAAHTTLVCVRDRASAELLRAIGVDRPIHVTADPVYLLAPDRPPAPRRGPRVVAIPRYSLTEVEAAALAESCDHVADRYGAQVLIAPFQTGYRDSYDDLPVAQSLQAHMRARAEVVVLPTTGAVIDLLQGADLVVSARLHGLIFAAIAGVAGIGIDYEPKVRGVMADAGQAEACVALPDLAAGRLPAVIDSLWPRRSQVGQSLAAYARGVRAAAARNFALFEALHTAVLAV